jgi:hypothetical protein
MTQMKEESIVVAASAADATYRGGVVDMKKHYGAGEIESHEGAARNLIYGENGIAKQLSASTDVTQTISILHSALQTFFKGEKTVGQLARCYTLGFANALKRVEPGFAEALVLAQREEATRPKATPPARGTDKEHG